MTKSIDVRTPGYEAIAKKWKLSVADVVRLVNDGAKVEKEHTKSLAKARQVARDHIAERPDYYKKLRKMEKAPVSVKEEVGVSGVRGLGYVSGDPALDPVNQYINTNSMSYEDMNGAILKMLRDRHNNHAALGFTSYDPTDKSPTNKALKEGTLNELGQGMPGYEGLSDSAPSQYRDNDSEKEDKPGKKKMEEGWASIGNPYDRFGDVNRRAKFYGKKPKATTTKNDEKDDTYKDSKQGGKVKFAKTVKEDQIDEVSKKTLTSYNQKASMGLRSNQPSDPKKAKKRSNREAGVKLSWNKVNNYKVKVPANEEALNELKAETLGSYIKKASAARKEALNKGGAKADVATWGKRQKGITTAIKKLTNEERTMETKDLINEALENILDNNLSNMKENLTLALQEKAMEKLEERKKEIASNYFAQ